MKNLRNSGIKRVAAIILAASMVLGSTNTFPVYAQEELAVESETDARAGTGLTIADYEEDVTAKYGEDVTFTVNATSEVGNISYQWYYYDDTEWEYIEIEGATESSYTVKADESAKDKYYCKVTDGIETEKTYFRLTVDSGLTIADYKDNVTAKYGEEATFTVNATSEAGNIRYKWLFYDPTCYKWCVINGATESSYTVKADENAKERYICEVTDGINHIDIDFMLSVEGGLIIENDLENVVTAKYGEEVTFTVNATSEAGKEISYQWYYSDFNFGFVFLDFSAFSVKIEGATESSYTVKTDETTKGTYYCMVTDGIETRRPWFYLKEDAGLEIDYEEDVTAKYGEDVTFTVNATSEATSETGKKISYQWYYSNIGDFDYSLIKGATQSSYTVTANRGTKGFYCCEVTNGIETEKAYFKLTVDSGLTIADYKKNVETKYGEEVTFAINATNEAGKKISYQWYRGRGYSSDIKIEGATESSYTVKADETTKGTCYCIVTDGIETEKAYFNLTVDTELEIDGEMFVTAEYGEDVTFTVNATSLCPNINYQWCYVNEGGASVKIEGATESSYTVKADENAKRCYCCYVTDGATIVIKGIRQYLYIYGTLTIADYEEDVTAKYGEDVTFTVNATSEVGNISYQWYYYDDTEWEYIEIEGATESSYTVKADENAKNEYYCEVTDGVETESVYFYLRAKPVEMEDCTISLPYTSTAYTGTALRPDVTVKYGTKVLQSGTDYTVSYENNINAGTASIIITGTNRYKYTGTTTKEFKIKAASLGKAAVDLSANSYNYDGKKKEPTVKSVKLGKQTLKAGTDYTVSYKNNTNIGTASVIITGIGNYTGTATKRFTIKAKKGTIFASGSYKYKITSSTEVAFAGSKNKNATTVTMPKTVKYGGQKFKVTSVADKAFSKNTKITSVIIGSNVKTIGTSAFEGCKKLSKVTIGSNVTKLGDKAFKGCTSLKSIMIPSKVTTIGKEAFRNCSKLSSITIKSTKLKKIDKNALKGIKSTAKIKVPTKELKAYKKLLKDKGQGKKVKIVK